VNTLIELEQIYSYMGGKIKIINMTYTIQLLSIISSAMLWCIYNSEFKIFQITYP